MKTIFSFSLPNLLQTLLSILLISSSQLFAQTDSTLHLFHEIQYDESGKIDFDDIQIVDSVEKSILHLRAKEFFANQFKSGRDVIQMDDNESSTIIGKAFTDIYIEGALSTTTCQLWYTIKIQAKDGRYKYNIYDLYFKTYPQVQTIGTSVTSIPSVTTAAEERFQSHHSKFVTKIDNKYKFQMLRTVNRLIKAIVASMNFKEEKNDDW